MEGLSDSSEVTTVPYNDIASMLNTGDIMLMSGVTSTGAVIKFFDNTQFSHVAIVSIVAIQLFECENFTCCFSGYKIQVYY